MSTLFFCLLEIHVSYIEIICWDVYERHSSGSSFTRIPWTQMIHAWIFSGNAGPLYLEPLRSQMISDLSRKLQLWDPNCLKVRETVDKLQVQDRGMFVSCTKESLRRLKRVLPDSPSLMILHPSILLGDHIWKDPTLKVAESHTGHALSAWPQDSVFGQLWLVFWNGFVNICMYVCMYIYIGW